MGRLIRFSAFALAILSLSRGADAQELRILRAEPIGAKVADLDAAIGNQTHLSFRAYGRQFELDLEPNDRLFAALPERQKAALQAYPVYKGRIAGIDSSWVRLTRIGPELHGAFWDGAHFYTIAPAAAVLPFAVHALDARGADSVVYRLSDVESAFRGGSCGVGAQQRLDGGAEYDGLIDELRQSLSATAVPVSQIEVAVIADFEFSNAFPANTQGELAARINIVDGIFSEQLGVTIVVPEFRVFSDSADPFTTTDAADLLDELGTYRESTTAIRDRGLAHLLTGRNLDSNIAGIAFLDSLCEPYGGVGLSEGTQPASITALIVAHEIGHNFGAPHDAEAGSLCASTPATFLMAPVLNGSSTFSQCSLDQMRPRAAAATCVTTAQVVDVTIEVPTPIRAIRNLPFDYTIEVRSQGSATAEDVSVNISRLGSFVVNSATAEGGTCATPTGGSVTCQLGNLPAGTSRRVTLNLTADFVGTFETIGTVSARNDRVPGNDSRSIPIAFGSAADVSIVISPPTVSSPTRETLTFTATVTSNGPQPATNVSVGFSGSGRTRLEAASAGGGTCVVDLFFAGCTLGTLAPGQSRVLTFSAVALSAGSFNAEVSVNATNDDVEGNDVARSSLVISAVSDAALGQGGTLTAIVGQPLTLQIPLSSVGPQAVDGVEVRISPDDGLVVESASAPGGACVPLNTQFACTFSTLPSGSNRLIEARIRGNSVTVGSIRSFINAGNDENSANNQSVTLVRVKQVADVSISSDPFQFLEGRLVTLRLPLRSTGINAITAAVVNIDLPTAVVASSATLAGGTCAVAAGDATCSIATLAADATAFIDIAVTASQAGNFLGTATVNAANDKDPSNNSTTLRFSVLPFVDAAVQAPASVIGFLSENVDVPFNITTLNQPVTGVSLRLDLVNGDASGVSIQATPQLGSCSVTGVVIDCLLGFVPARSSIAVTVRFRSPQPRRFELRAELSGDADGSNNQLRIPVAIDQRADVALEPGTDAVTATVNNAFNYGFDVSVIGLPGLDNVSVVFPLPSSFVATAATAAGGSCAITAASVTCTFASFPGGGSVRRVQLTLRASSAGSFTTTITVSAANDAGNQNNTRPVTFTINAPPPPPPPPSSGGGGGGGGSLSWPYVAMLLLFAWQRARRIGIGLGVTP